MKQFILSFQMFIRNGYPIVLLATGLYENISSLENEKNVTFLIRSPKIYLSPLNINEIAASYETTLSLSRENALKCAKLTKGYAFAFQLLGYILYEQKAKAITPKVLSAFDSYLSEYVYTKIWSTLSSVEQKIISNIKSNSGISVSEILKRCDMKKEYFSRYRERLIKKGILYSPTHGKLIFALPRFKEFIEVETMLDF